MTTAALRRPPGPRAGDNLSGSFALALLMHGLLFGAMTLAVQWRTQPAAPVVAELWSALPALPEPTPQVVEPPPPPPPPKVEAEPEKPADITLKQEKKTPEPKPEEKKPEPKKEEKKKPEPRKAEPAKKVEEKPLPQTDLERLMAQAGTAAPAATGAAAGASGVRGSDSGYSARVIGCIRPHIVFAVPEGTAASVYAEFRIELLPDASVAGVRLLRASGLPGYDAAAERAIRRCDPFPRKSDGTLDRTIDVRMYPVEPR